LSPLTSSSADAEVVRAGRPSYVLWEVVPIEIVIIFQGVPKGLCMNGFAIKRFWCTTNVLEGAGAAMIGARGARLENGGGCDAGVAEPVDVEV